MYNIIPLKQFRIKLTQYAKQVSEHGNSFIVLKKSKPLFKIVPIDEDSWDTVVDFTQIDPKGVPLNKVKQALEELLEE